MQKNFITYKTSRINYYRFGKGVKWLFCFHGYGEDGSSFYIMENELGHDYTLVAIDMPFHGATEWREGLLFTKNDILEVIKIITNEADAPFCLLGYSMGGRIALSLLQDWFAEIERVVLLAPDGLYAHFWKSFTTQTNIGNKLFKYAMKEPGLLFGAMKLGNVTGLLNKSVFKFAHYYLDDKESRLLLYKRWTTLRKLEVDIHAVKDAVNSYAIPVRLLYGAYDRIAVSKHANYFKEGIEQHVKIYMAAAGHQLLKEKYTEDIASLFYE